MEKLTLEKLKAMPISQKVASEIQRLGTELCWNMKVDQHRMMEGDKYYRSSVLFNMTHSGNDPRTISEILDRARLYIHYNVFTDEEWESYLLPYINDEIERQLNFKRWMPGYVIRNKQTGKLAIVRGDYAYICGGRNFTDFHVYDLDASGRIVRSWAWAHYDDYELIDEDHVAENIAKMVKYES